MSKAITEVAIGAAAIAASIAIPGVGIAATGLMHMGALASGLLGIGASEVLAGLGSALEPQHAGLAVSAATPIGNWSYVYGTQKVGGIEIFRESNNNTGVSGSTSNNKQLHRVFHLACHPCSIGGFQLRIDGKEVPLNTSGSDHVSYSPSQITCNISSISRTAGVVTMVLASPMPSGTDGTTLQIRGVADNTFNCTAVVTQPNPTDLTTWTYVCGGPDATSAGGQARTTYPDYKDKIRVSFLDGNHTATFPTLLAAGTSWGPNDLCLGHTLAYVQMGYDDSVFPSGIPNVSFVIDGKKDIWDPRESAHVFTKNAALCIADFLCTPTKRGGFGLTMGTDIPTAALIAAANICDEAVDLAAGGTTPRYTCNTFFTLNETRGSILANMLTSCAGRITYQGGQYSVVPAAWVTPTLQLTDADMVGPIKWNPRLSIRDSANAMRGTYTSPENAYQLADVPAYAQDALHGYVSDPWLAEDNGERIYRDAHFPCTDSSAIAQRLAKISLLRLRQQGRGTFRFNLKAYQAVALDVIQITHPRYTWLNKAFEVLSSRFVLEKAQDGAVRPCVELDVAETDSAIYDWTPTEQLTPQGYKQPNNVGVNFCARPEDVTAYSGPGAVISGITYPSTITTRADGTVDNSIYIRWNTPNDANVVSGGHLEVQYQLNGASAWTPAGGKIDPSTDHRFVGNVSDGAQYNLQVRAVNCAGVPSEWVFVGPVTVGSSYSTSSYSGQPIAPAGTLSAQGLIDGTAQITVLSFTNSLTGTSCTPSPAVITGLNQSQLYHVYYVDATFSGGTITPIATQNTADYIDHAGYFLIGDIVTPSYTPRYRPSHFSDVGSSSTVNPSAAYDNDVTTAAIVEGSWWTTTAPGPVFTYHSATGDCIWNGFPAVTLGSSATLHVVLSAQQGGTGPAFSGVVTVKIGGSSSTLASVTGTTAETDYTMTIPSGTDLSTISVEAVATATVDTSPGGGAIVLKGFETYIQ